MRKEFGLPLAHRLGETGDQCDLARKVGDPVAALVVLPRSFGRVGKPCAGRPATVASSSAYPTLLAVASRSDATKMKAQALN